MKSIVLFLTVIVVLGLIAGCGDDGGGSQAKDTTPPTVFLTNPADGATGISPNKSIWISFSEPMDEASLDSIFIGGEAPGHIEYDMDSHSATLWPGEVLDAETECEVRVAAAVQDQAGNEMENDHFFAYTTGPFSCGGLSDQFEGNDDIANAAPVELDTWYWLVPSCGSDARYDYYKYTLTDAAMTTVKVHFVYADTTHLRWGIHFYRADGDDYSTLGTGHWPYPGDFDYHYSFLPGTYYAMIYKQDDDPFTGVYNFVIETSEPCVDDQYEDNDFADEATSITAGLHEGLRGCYVDADYYSIEMAPGKTLKVTMTETTTRGGSRTLRLWGPGVSVGGTNQVEPRTEMVLTQAGTYYILTQWWTDGVIYDLNIEVLD